MSRHPIRLALACLVAALLASTLGATSDPARASGGGPSPTGLQIGGAPGHGGALVVGDSLEVLTAPYLQRHLPGVPVTVNAEGGYNSYQIYDLFKQSYDQSQSVIVFDAGTNDNPAYPQILQGNLAKVAATVGGRCMVVPTIHGFTVNGVDNSGKNQVVRSFAASRPGTQVPDWAHIVATRPDLMQSDDLHPNAAGADVRAQIIASAIKACLAPPLPPAKPRRDRVSHARINQRTLNVPRAPGSIVAGAVRHIAVFVQPQVVVLRILMPQVVFLRGLAKATASAARA
ncbi:MAG: hypothetical protein ACRDK1_09895 [Solirubrobacterales bacterium]